MKADSLAAEAPTNNIWPTVNQPPTQAWACGVVFNLVEAAMG
jgi:hypothetical protein